MDSALTKACIWVFLIILGYVLKAIGIFKQEDSKVLSRVMIYVTLPAVVLRSFRSFEVDFRLLGFVVIGSVSCAILALVGKRMGRKEEPLTRAMYMVGATGFNIGAFSIPFLQNLFPHLMAQVVLFDIGNSLMINGTVYSFACMELDASQRFSIKRLLSTLFHTFLFCVYMFLMVCALLHVTFPSVVYQTADIVAAANGPVVMLMMGMLFEPRLKPESLHQVLTIVGLRYGTVAAVSVIVFLAMPFSVEEKILCTLMLFSPICSLAPVFCEKMGCDPDVYGTASTLTIPISVCLILGATVLLQSGIL